MYRTICLLLGFLVVPSAHPQSLLSDGARKLEEIRLQQLDTVQADAEISAFTTDGCSGNLSRGWEQLARLIPKFREELGDRPPWESCCIAHDRHYWRGVTIDGYNARKRADQDLRQCVVDTGTRLAPELSARFSKSEAQVEQAFTVVADLMYRAVRFGGQPCSLLPWRWGYGWPRCAIAPLDEA